MTHPKSLSTTHRGKRIIIKLSIIIALNVLIFCIFSLKLRLLTVVKINEDVTPEDSPFLDDVYDVAKSDDSSSAKDSIPPPRAYVSRLRSIVRHVTHDHLMTLRSKASTSHVDSDTQNKKIALDPFDASSLDPNPKPTANPLPKVALLFIVNQRMYNGELWSAFFDRSAAAPGFTKRPKVPFPTSASRKLRIQNEIPLETLLSRSLFPPINTVLPNEIETQKETRSVLLNVESSALQTPIMDPISASLPRFPPRASLLDSLSTVLVIQRLLEKALDLRPKESLEVLKQYFCYRQGFTAKRNEMHELEHRNSEIEGRKRDADDNLHYRSDNGSANSSWIETDVQYNELIETLLKELRIKAMDKEVISNRHYHDGNQSLYLNYSSVYNLYISSQGHNSNNDGQNINGNSYNGTSKNKTSVEALSTLFGSCGSTLSHRLAQTGPSHSSSILDLKSTLYGNANRLTSHEKFFNKPMKKKDQDPWQKMFSLYVHLSANVNRTTTPDALPGVFAGADIIQTYDSSKAYGKFMLVEIMIALLERALGDPWNQKFVFLSESSIPIHSPETIWLQLMWETKSRIHSCPQSPWESDLYRWNEEARSEWMNSSTFRKSSQWIVLKRSHVRLVVADRHVRVVFKRVCTTHQKYDSCYMDEHYFASLLAVYSLENETDCVGLSHHIEWLVPKSSHPHTFLISDFFDAPLKAKGDAERSLSPSFPTPAFSMLHQRLRSTGHAEGKGDVGETEGKIKDVVQSAVEAFDVTKEEKEERKRQRMDEGLQRGRKDKEQRHLKEDQQEEKRVGETNEKINVYNPSFEEVLSYWIQNDLRYKPLTYYDSLFARKFAPRMKNWDSFMALTQTAVKTEKARGLVDKSFTTEDIRTSTEHDANLNVDWPLLSQTIADVRQEQKLNEVYSVLTFGMGAACTSICDGKESNESKSFCSGSPRGGGGIGIHC